MKDRNLIRLLVILIGVALISCITLILVDNYNLNEANEQLKEELHNVKTELETCKEQKLNVESERDNVRMALDETYELFLSCHRAQEGDE